MGVFRRSSPPPPDTALSLPTRRGITAAAEQVRFATSTKTSIESFRTARSSSQSEWQHYAYEYTDQIGELAYAFNLVASLASRCRIYPSVTQDPDRPAQPVQDVEDLTPGLKEASEAAIASLGGSPQTGSAAADSHGISGLVRNLALNLLIAGEAYLIQQPPRYSEGRSTSKWKVYSIDEVVISKDNPPKIHLKTSRYQRGLTDTQELPPTTFIARIWRPDPRYSDDPISSMKAVLPMCSELVLINQAIQATATSRLNAGALYLPDGLSASSTLPTPETDDNTPSEEAEFEEALMEAMTTPIQDPNSASAVVPLIIRGPAELADSIKQFSFERPFDETMIQRADKLMDRILAGIDIPKDIVSGLANIKYSNSISIQDEFMRGHIEPLMDLICQSLTTTFLHPYLQSRGYTPEQSARVTFSYDQSEIVNRPNKNADAAALYNAHALSANAWRRAAGFAETDAPSPSEIVRRMVVEHAQMSPELFESLLRVIAPTMMDDATTNSPAAQGLPPEVAQALGMRPSASEGAPAPIEQTNPDIPSVDDLIDANTPAPGGQRPPAP